MPEALPLNLVFVLILLGGWAAGRLMLLLKLPAVLGMLLFGVGLGALPLLATWPEGLVVLEPFFKSFALVVILLRAGLGLRRQTLHRIGPTALAMAILPCLLEGITLTLALRLIFGFEWAISAMGAFMLAAVSPAVVVPAMLHLSESGYGKRNEVPTLILAGASVDDVLAITLFAIFTRMATAESVGVAEGLLLLPRALLLGLIPGWLLGLALARWFNKAYTRIRATEKTIVLITLALMLVQVGDWLHSAALLGVMTVGFLLLERAEPVAHELAGKLARIWIFAEIFLFVLIGMQVEPAVALQAGPRALLVIVLGLSARSLGVWISTSRSRMGRGERFFCVLAFLPKATVQAALGGVALGLRLPGGDVLLALAVLSILITAPLGLIGIRLAGPKLLDLAPPDLADPEDAD